jgi:uncharacterized membrane protein YjjP (DUF1212 family)
MEGNNQQKMITVNDLTQKLQKVELDETNTKLSDVEKQLQIYKNTFGNFFFQHNSSSFSNL